MPLANFLSAQVITLCPEASQWAVWGTFWHTDAGCQSIFRENIGFFGFSVRSLEWRYTEWHPWNGQELKADWDTMIGVELYDYRTVDMTDFDQFDRVNVVAEPTHAEVVKEMASVLHAHFNNMW